MSQCVPSPEGVAIVNAYSNGTPVAYAYCPNVSSFTCLFTDAATYVNDISRHSIFVPLVQLLPDAGGITDWSNASQYVWSFDYVDTLISTAIANGKTFSLAVVVGEQSGSNYQSSLPANFEGNCNPTGDAATTCAPFFHWWKGGSVGACRNAFVPAAWNANVRQMWIQAAYALAAHLKQKTTDAGVPFYDSLTFVHLSGLSLYDEELRLPTAVYPATAPAADSGVKCPADPDGAVWLAAQVINESAYSSTYTGYGYGSTWDAATVVEGITSIAAGFGAAFPDRIIAMSMFDPGAVGAGNNLDFPDFIDDAAVVSPGVGDFANRIVGSIVDAAIPPSRLMIQSDDLASPNRNGTNWILPEVTALASQYAFSLKGWSGTLPLIVAWQTNKVGSPTTNMNTIQGNITGAKCDNSDCIEWVGSTTAGTYYLLNGTRVGRGGYPSRGVPGGHRQRRLLGRLQCAGGELLLPEPLLTTGACRRPTATACKASRYDPTLTRRERRR